MPNKQQLTNPRNLQEMPTAPPSEVVR